MQEITKKLQSRAGESIGETLVALLISALALVMLAGAVSAGTRVITQSRDKTRAYYEAGNKMVTGKDAHGSLTVNLIDSTSNNPVNLYSDPMQIKPIVYYWNSENSSVIMYEQVD